jgi:predicted DNA binding CopG/RHH family protein
MEEPMNTNKIPQTDSIHELAQFWDTHDITYFEGQLEEVTEPVFEREKVVQVHLSTKDAETVESMAQSQGLNPGDLIRTWIMEKVQPSS